MAHLINNAQKGLLKLAQKQLGLDDDDYRAKLHELAGVRSSTKLTLPKYRVVLDEFQRMGFVKRPGRHEFTGYAARLKHWRDAAGTRPRMATPEQLARIETDWDGMRWYWAPKGFGNYKLSLRGFLKSQTGVSDLCFLRFSQAHNTIEALKNIIKRRGTSSMERAL